MRASNLRKIIRFQSQRATAAGGVAEGSRDAVIIDEALCQLASEVHAITRASSSGTETLNWHLDALDIGIDEIADPSRRASLQARSRSIRSALNEKLI